eukprot:10676248-Heterocapsa_arctica.AAC.1
MHRWTWGCSNPWLADLLTTMPANSGMEKVVMASAGAVVCEKAGITPVRYSTRERAGITQHESEWGHSCAP